MKPETEFTVIDTRTPGEWEAWGGRNVTITREGVELSRSETPTYIAPRPIWEFEWGNEESEVSRLDMDVDVDPCGARYILDDGALYRAAPSTDSFKELSCDGLDAGRGNPRAFCLSGDAIYVVGSRSTPEGDDWARPQARQDQYDDDRRTGYVQALSARSHQTRWILESVDGKEFVEPVRVARNGSNNSVYVLDRGGGFVARVDPDGKGEVLDIDLDEPFDLAVDEQGNVGVLDEGGFKWYQPGETDSTGGARKERQALDTITPSCIEGVSPGLFVVGVDAEDPDDTQERTLYWYEPSRDSLARLSSFKRSCLRLRRGWDTKTGDLYAIDTDGTAWVLEAASTIQPEGEEAIGVDTAEAEPYAGVVATRVDLGAVDAEYARIHVDIGEQPPGTRVDLRYVTTDSEQTPTEVLETGSDKRPRWSSDEQECPSDGSRSGRPEVEPPGGPNPSHTLVPVEGRRFLWLRLDLVGDQYTSPRVDAVKISVSHDSYLDYLPVLYRENERSAAFLERFLSVFEDTYADVDHGIRTLTEYFDPCTIPAPHLSWLGSWLAIAEDDAWSAESKRTLISEAPNLFKRRGTPRGLSELLEIYLSGTDPKPIRCAAADTEEARAGTERHPKSKGESESEHGGIEATRGFVRDDSPRAFVLEYGDLGPVVYANDDNHEDSENLEECVDDAAGSPEFEGPVCCPQEFLVLLDPTVGEEARATAERIVDSQRPVHTVGRVVSLEAGGRLGDHLYLGVNTYLPPEEFVVGESRLGSTSRIGSDEVRGQLEWQSRLDEDLELW